MLLLDEAALKCTTAVTSGKVSLEQRRTPESQEMALLVRVTSPRLQVMVYMAPLTRLGHSTRRT